jgi:hypothetical protein
MSIEEPGRANWNGWTDDAGRKRAEYIGIIAEIPGIGVGRAKIAVDALLRRLSREQQIALLGAVRFDPDYQRPTPTDFPNQAPAAKIAEAQLRADRRALEEIHHRRAVEETKIRRIEDRLREQARDQGKRNSEQ